MTRTAKNEIQTRAQFRLNFVGYSLEKANGPPFVQKRGNVSQSLQQTSDEMETIFFVARFVDVPRPRNSATH